MIGTAFYALGVIICMILIVIAALVGVAIFLEALPYLAGLALLGLVLWAFVATGVGQFLLIGGFIALVVWMVALLVFRFFTRKARHTKEARAEEEKWLLWDKNWKERKSPSPWEMAKQDQERQLRSSPLGPRSGAYL